MRKLCKLLVSLSLPSLTRLDRGVFCVFQGETLYFPTGWVHATSNIGEGVAIGMQATYNFKERKATGENAGGLNGTDFFALKDMGIAYKSAAEGMAGTEAAAGHVAKSAAAYEAALEMMPAHWMSYNDLGELYRTAARHEEQHAVAMRFVESVRQSLGREEVPVAMKAIGCETASAAAYFAGNTRDAVMVRNAKDFLRTASATYCADENVVSSDDPRDAGAGADGEPLLQTRAGGADPSQPRRHVGAGPEEPPQGGQSELHRRGRDGPGACRGAAAARGGEADAAQVEEADEGVRVSVKSLQDACAR